VKFGIVGQIKSNCRFCLGGTIEEPYPIQADLDYADLVIETVMMGVEQLFEDYTSGGVIHIVQLIIGGKPKYPRTLSKIRRPIIISSR